jgi:hypothetical protein
MSVLIAFGQWLLANGVDQARLIVLEFPSWGSFYNVLMASSPDLAVS